MWADILFILTWPCLCWHIDIFFYLILLDLCSGKSQPPWLLWFKYLLQPWKHRKWIKNRIQALQNNRRLKKKKKRKFGSPLLTTSDSLREDNPQIRVKGVGPGSRPSGHSGALLAPYLSRLVTPSHLMLNQWFRVWPGNSIALYPFTAWANYWAGWG